jgi:DeoR family transcriptional regulator of aga operon
LILARPQRQLRAPCASFRALTIITNALNIAAELSGASLEVILTGGTLRKNSFSLVGPIAEETLYRLNGDILFLAVDGFDVHHGLTTPNLLEAKVNRAMMDVARTVVVVCDSSKFGRRTLSSIAHCLFLLHHAPFQHASSVRSGEFISGSFQGQDLKGADGR